MANNESPIIVIISSNAEWRSIKNIFPEEVYNPSLYGEWFQKMIGENEIIFFHGGWGKISSAASTQYAISRWNPRLLINLGVCGGFEGKIERGEIILVNQTVVYDIIEQMGDFDEYKHYSTQIDLTWLNPPFPHPVRETLIVSGDRDLLPSDIPILHNRFGAIAGDWESASIAYVAARNNVRLLILRGVTDLVSEKGGEAYGNLELFEASTHDILPKLVSALPEWIKAGSNV